MPDELNCKNSVTVEGVWSVDDIGSQKGTNICSELVVTVHLSARREIMSVS